MTDQLITASDAERHAPIRRVHDTNVGKVERIVCGASGGALIGAGLRVRGILGWAGVALGAALAWHAARRHSATYAALGIGSDDAGPWSSPLSREVHSRASITINRGPEELYDAWRDLPRLARFFPRVESIEEIGENRSRWTVRLPTGQAFSWTAVITEDREGRAIRWKSDDGAFDHGGVVSFREAGGRGTAVTLEQRYHLPLGAIGVLLAKLLGSDPQNEASTALRRFKQWIETGEIATNTGPAARGDGITAGSVREAVFPDAGRRRPRRDEQDRVDEASMESFPASDPPAYTGVTASRGSDGA